MNARHRIEAVVARGCEAEGRGGWAVVGLWALVLVPFAGTRNLYHEEGRYTVAALAVRLAWLAAIPFDVTRNEDARRLAETLAAPLGNSRDPLLVVGPAID